MREILRAVVTGKPIVALLEPEAKHGGLTQEQIRAQLIEADGYYMAWGLAEEVASWGYEIPTPDKMYDALFAREPIEWNRIGAFQDVSMRLVGESILTRGRRDTVMEERTRSEAGSARSPSARSPSTRSPSTRSPFRKLFAKRFRLLSQLSDKMERSERSERSERVHQAATVLQGELTYEKPTVPPPRNGRKYHIYCSVHNTDAAELLREVASHFELKVAFTESIEHLESCERMIVYLTGLTWTSGEASAVFASEVQRAMDKLVPLLLCHEMPGVGGQAERHACDFGLFFSNSRGATPQELLRQNIYSQIATPLKGGAWRGVSMVMVAQALAAPLPEQGDEDVMIRRRLVLWPRSDAKPILREHRPEQGDEDATIKQEQLPKTDSAKSLRERFHTWLRSRRSEDACVGEADGAARGWNERRAHDLLARLARVPRGGAGAAPQRKEVQCGSSENTEQARRNQLKNLGDMEGLVGARGLASRQRRKLWSLLEAEVELGESPNAVPPPAARTDPPGTRANANSQATAVLPNVVEDNNVQLLVSPWRRPQGPRPGVANERFTFVAL